MNRIKGQLLEFLKGFYDVVPEPLLSVFDFQEVELLLHGLPNIDMDDWIRQVGHLLIRTSNPIHSVIPSFQLLKPLLPVYISVVIPPYPLLNIHLPPSPLLTTHRRSTPETSMVSPTTKSWPGFGTPYGDSSTSKKQNCCNLWPALQVMVDASERCFYWPSCYWPSNLLYNLVDTYSRWDVERCFYWPSSCWPTSYAPIHPLVTLFT